MIERCIRGCQGVAGRIFVYHGERGDFWGGHPLLEKLRKTFLLGLGADVARGFLASVVVVVYDSEIPTLGIQPAYAACGIRRR